MARRSDQPDRRDQLLDEALQLVSEGGLAAVTHRAVERAAGVPHGSVTYHFGSRDDLIDALVERMVASCEQEVAVIARDVSMALAGAAGRASDSGLDLDAVADALVRWMDDGRHLHLARFELELAAARDARLRERMTAAAEVFWRMCEPIVLAMGSADPVLDGRAMGAAVDGLLLDHLSHDPADPAVIRVGARQLLRSWAPVLAS
ncbi:TetR family transcriptional regulator [Patulibacter sp. NPDC049589]|uniref:TetR/AcrR family transcriptional regulator n=1 Tax=Patulibacter sp. NPDC049589 TaxID=3154731 RepID=UPI003415CFAD